MMSDPNRYPAVKPLHEVPHSIHHVQLGMPAGREAEAIAFYEGVLGIGQVAKPSHLAIRGGCWFEHGDLRVHLGIEESFRPAIKAHPALMTNDLDTLRERLESAGVSTTEDEPLPGFRRFYAADPFGNRIEFLQEDG